MIKENYYKILEIPINSSKEEIKKAYKKMAIKYHPDKQNDKSDEEKANAESKFKEVAEAYDMLMNPEKINNNPDFTRRHIDPNELFNQFFNMHINSSINPSSRMNININGINIGHAMNSDSNSANCVMRSSSISIVNGQKVEKIIETINGVTSVKTIISGRPNINAQCIRINRNN